MIVVAGEVLVDIFEDYERIGGAPFNFAFHLHQMGLSVRLLTRVGNDDYGRQIVALLEHHQFDLRDVQIDHHFATGTVRVEVDDRGVPQFDIVRDVAYDHLDLSTASTIDWSDVRMIYFGTLIQRTPNGLGQIKHLLDQKTSQTTCFCDINLRPPHIYQAAVELSLRHADILKLNNEELVRIQTWFDGPARDRERISWLLDRFSIEILALTLGEQGSTIVASGQVVNAPPPKSGSVVDTVGAGDAYAAVLAMGYLNGLPMAQTVEAATEFAAHICSLPGAVPDDLSIYNELREQLRKKTK